MTEQKQMPSLVAWMNAEHLEEYRKGTPNGIGWASPEKSDFYSVPLYDLRETQVPAGGKAGALVVEDQNASANEAPATRFHIVTVLRAMADNYANGHAWSEVDSYQVLAAADAIERVTAELEKFVAAHAIERKQKLAAVNALEEIRDMPVMTAVAVYEIARAAIAKATADRNGD